MDSQFPDIVSKPGQFLPSIFGGETMGEFDVENLEKDVLDKATVLQQKLIEERQKEIDLSKNKRVKELAAHKASDNNDDNKERIKKGLQSLGLEDHKSKDLTEMEKRKQIMSGLKGLMK